MVWFARGCPTPPLPRAWLRQRCSRRNRRGEQVAVQVTVTIAQPQPVNSSRRRGRTRVSASVWQASWRCASCGRETQGDDSAPRIDGLRRSATFGAWCVAIASDQGDTLSATSVLPALLRIRKSPTATRAGGYPRHHGRRIRAGQEPLAAQPIGDRHVCYVVPSRAGWRCQRSGPSTT